MDHKNCVIEIDCIEHSYPDGTNVHVCNTHMHIQKGDKIFLSGKNGSGKSTLLHHMIGLLKPTKGVIKVLGTDSVSKEFERVRKNVGVVFQNVDSQLVAPTVFDDIAFAPLNYGWPAEKVAKEVNSIMAALGITHLKNKVPHYLSEGEKKKVALAGALVTRPKILLLDEVFANMDRESEKKVMDYLNRLNKTEKTTIVLASHDDKLIKKFKGRTVNLDHYKRF